MTRESGKESNVNRKEGFRLFRQLNTYIVAGIAIWYFIMSSLAPVRYVRDVNLTYGYDTPADSPAGPEMAADSHFLALSARVSFVNARIRMAAFDSVGLSVNLADSIIALEIKGVTVREVPVVSFRTASSFRSITSYAWIKLLSEPLTISNSRSTIPKEPIVVTIAPRDTSEASARPLNIPDTSAVDPVCFALTTNIGIRLLILQETTGRDDDYRKIRRFLFGLAVSDTWRGFKRIVLFRIPEFEPEIRLVISKADTMAVYRSLPLSGQLALRIR